MLKSSALRVGVKTLYNNDMILVIRNRACGN